MPSGRCHGILVDKSKYTAGGRSSFKYYAVPKQNYGEMGSGAGGGPGEISGPGPPYPLYRDS